jgi:hypothetical protein
MYIPVVLCIQFFVMTIADPRAATAALRTVLQLRGNHRRGWIIAVRQNCARLLEERLDQIAVPPVTHVSSSTICSLFLTPILNTEEC